MDKLDERIAALEEEIKGYVAKFEAATTEKELDRYTSLITASRETLNRLLDEKKAALLTPAGVQHANPPLSGPTNSLIIKIKIENQANNTSIVVNVLVDGGCEVTPLLIHYRDIEVLGLTRRGPPLLTLLGDHQHVREMEQFSEVKVTLTFDDGEEISSTFYPTCFLPSETDLAPTHAIVGEDERILGYPALFGFGLKQDFKKHRLIKALRRL